MTSRSGHPKVTAAMPSSVIPNDLREKKIKTQSIKLKRVKGIR
jgi:hypothetical protein